MPKCIETHCSRKGSGIESVSSPAQSRHVQTIAGKALNLLQQCSERRLLSLGSIDRAASVNTTSQDEWVRNIQKPAASKVGPGYYSEKSQCSRRVLDVLH